MVTYEITHAGAAIVWNFEKRKRAPAARDALWRAIHELLRSHALLDRPVALRLKAEFDACEVSPPKRGHMRYQTFSLGGAYIDTVTFTARRS